MRSVMELEKRMKQLLPVAHHEELEKLLENLIEEHDEEISVKCHEIDSLEEKMEEAVGAPDLDYEFVGLDEIAINLRNGNLVIQQEVDAFVERLKQKYHSPCSTY